MINFQINDRLVGDGYPIFIIAEAGDNHMGSLSVAKEMIRLAKLTGADAIKFQHHLPDEEMLPDIPMSNNMHEPLYDFLKRNSLNIEDHILLKNYCDEVGIQYMCTPFSFAAAKELYDNFLLDVVKIGSGEMTDIPSLMRIAEFGIPMIVSTGMSTIDEIKETYNILIGCGVKLALMNCVSEYPPVYEDINLGVIGVLKKEFPQAIIGQSDHTPTNYTCFAASALGVKIIEKHVTINKLTPCPDQTVSLDFEEFHDLVRGIRIIEMSSGITKKIHNNEISIRKWAFRSLVALRDIKAGEVITCDMIWGKRPGTGIPSKEMPKLIGKVALVDIPKNTLISWAQVK